MGWKERGLGGDVFLPNFYLMLHEARFHLKLKPRAHFQKRKEILGLQDKRVGSIH